MFENNKLHIWSNIPKNLNFKCNYYVKTTDKNSEHFDLIDSSYSIFDDSQFCGNTLTLSYDLVYKNIYILINDIEFMYILDNGDFIL